MNSPMVGNSKIREAMAGFTAHPDYESLPESMKLVHSPQGFAWMSTEKDHVIERECNPDYDVSE